ncbi:MAG: YciI family protein [Prochlorococcaceae cyanobacterium]|jgi:uncharacterized protein YciI
MEPKRWFVKLEEGVVDRARFDAVVPAHLAWVAQLEAAGHRPSSGYWRDRQGLPGAGGMLLFQARDSEEAERLVRSDPLVREGCVRWVVHEWRLVAGELRNGTAAPAPSSAGGTPVPPGSDPAPPAVLP